MTYLNYYFAVAAVDLPDTPNNLETNMLEFAIDMLEQARLSRNQNIPPPSSVTTTFLLKKLCSRLRIEESNKIDVKKQLFYYFFNGTEHFWWC